jgi:hypothetical protein
MNRRCRVPEKVIHLLCHKATVSLVNGISANFGTLHWVLNVYIHFPAFFSFSFFFRTGSQAAPQTEGPPHSDRLVWAIGAKLKLTECEQNVLPSFSLIGAELTEIDLSTTMSVLGRQEELGRKLWWRRILLTQGTICKKVYAI